MVSVTVISFQVGTCYFPTLFLCESVLIFTIRLKTAVIHPVEDDNTYSATVSWRRRHGYRIDFWGKGNDLESLPLNAARAYFRTGIQENGWSMMEIETSAEYPDDVQAYAAGLLEGSLTWHLVHYHWSNTIGVACASRPVLCRDLRKYLRENAASVRKKAATSRSEDPFWHMVHLYYVQLDGLAEGWRFAVDRSRQDAFIEPEDFLWLAMASDVPDLERAIYGSDHHIATDGMIVLKSIFRPDMSAPLLALAHNTAAPYARMLRVIKRYKFVYHSSPSDSKSAQVPGQSIVMTSYPGALSSQDESYAISGKDLERQFVVAGTPIIIGNRTVWQHIQTKDLVMSPARIMAANRLAVDGSTWSRLLDRQNSGTSNRQWIGLEPREGRVSLIEQMPDGTLHTDVSEDFAARGYLACTGALFSDKIKKQLGGKRDDAVFRSELLALLQLNISDIDQLRNLMRGDVLALQTKKSNANSQRSNKTETTSRPGNNRTSVTSDAIGNNSNVLEDNAAQLLAYRGDLKAIAEGWVPRPTGVIDSKLFIYDPETAELSFDARSGPASRPNVAPFSWSRNFPNSSHLGQPDTFAFDSVAPNWVWIA
ncbi:hypothetical protein QAD02_017090 [Eretmocerus hayati]|uniref:Uncharacterized protein n=1 Tax=Eretmocerus hayati TaxID=131215 RepID=A0ACC2PDY4_9HYME|nr:hypothetical protein QAD02_017090 [Eretmocerus hayati]